MGIWQDSSSAYHPAGNRLAENVVQRLKKAIADRTIEDAMQDIVALNHAPPYKDQRLTPFESLTGLVSPLNGIPMTDKSRKELVSREWLTEKVNAKENPLPTHPDNNTTNGEDNHAQTDMERIQSKDWVEKIQARPTQQLSIGDRVYFVAHHTKGYNRWRTGIILDRKSDYEYSTGTRRSHGYILYDIENCTTVSRTRADIRKYKNSKVERKLLETAQKHLQGMREEFFKNERFRNEISSPPAEFEIPSDYGQSKEKTPTKATEPKPNNIDQSTQEEPTEQTTPQEDEPQITEIPEEAPQPRRMSRELKNLKSDLNGPAHFNDSWDNVIHLQDEENTEDHEGSMEQRD